MNDWKAGDKPYISGGNIIAPRRVKSPGRKVPLQRWEHPFIALETRVRDEHEAMRAENHAMRSEIESLRNHVSRLEERLEKYDERVKAIVKMLG